MDKQATAAATFVGVLRRFVETKDRAALAALRRGLGRPPGTVAETYPYVVPYLPDPETFPGSRRQYERFERAAFMVASLFASHHEAQWEPVDGGRSNNFGASWGLLARRRSAAAVERRFMALLRCRENEIFDHLRHGVNLMRSEQVPVDWQRLLLDLPHWSNPDRVVQRSWARTYYLTLGDTAGSEEQAGDQLAVQPGRPGNREFRAKGR